MLSFGIAHRPRITSNNVSCMAILCSERKYESVYLWGADLADASFLCDGSDLVDKS